MQKKPVWVQFRKKSEDKKVSGNILSVHSWGGAAGFAAAAATVKAPEDSSVKCYAA